MKWADLRRWFGFAAPELKKRGRPPKELPWWFEWPEDLRTLDLTEVLDGFDMLGECLSADERKWSAKNAYFKGSAFFHISSSSFRRRGGRLQARPPQTAAQGGRETREQLLE